MADDTSSPSPPSTVPSPTLRTRSPSPSVSPSLALDAIPRLDRSVSTPSTSTSSTLSTRSRPSRIFSDGSAATIVRRRGYMRPQGTAFADSARNRDSVMSLGSIAHMQYYFARTGLLDGKGAQLAKGERKISGGLAAPSGKENLESPVVGGAEEYGLGAPSVQDGLSSCGVSESGLESPTDLQESFWENGAQTGVKMLPPTVSTYKLKPSYTEPLPDMPVLRRELKEALQDACKVLEESQKHATETTSGQDNNGFFEIQGLHVLDLLTLAIRAAKNYYTAHSDHTKLYTIKSEKNLRSDLYQVLDILKRMASRNFRGGVKVTELAGIVSWIESIDHLIKCEEQLEEREREWLFLKSFNGTSHTLPAWPERFASSEVFTTPGDFLLALQDGQLLIQIHNTFVSRSKRKFGQIKTWHTDVAKPYRRAENLRYWLKAAELRFDVRVSMPVLDVINGKAWGAFEDAILKWSQGVRETLMRELATDARVDVVPELHVLSEGGVAVQV
ncbi:hypothetical protein B0A48_16930 [Cryoendolithus antarcticus]|uniref:Calponin-homology (CH) domain-containing protein n=1 Tax=Cryoendolithus antarcticus TaxID=1507870 RepID=A0A1V8SCT0_9PEZI|nr:hypothetical protein B0A48_16930 [Cryoendolithus antarcticus]